MIKLIASRNSLSAKKLVVSIRRHAKTHRFITVKEVEAFTYELSLSDRSISLSMDMASSTCAWK